MSNYLSEDGTFINSLIGEGTLFKGDISLNGLLRIDGDFKGSITEGGKVLIGKSGRAEASVRAGTVVIGGVLKGDIVATEKVVILSSGLVIGNITAPRLLIEDGVVLNGFCRITESDSAEEGASGRSSGWFGLSFSRKQEMETASSWTK